MFLSDFRPVSHDARSLALHTDLPLTQRWTQEAIMALNLFIANLTLKAGSTSSLHALCEAALAINFAFAKAPSSQRLQYATRVRAGFHGLTAIYGSAIQRFTNATDEEARRHFPAAKYPILPPAYANFHGRIYFTSNYRGFNPSTSQGFGPSCRAAMVLHECFHIIDLSSGRNAIHISEFSEPAFSNQSPEQKIHNPSAYASFAGQIFEKAMQWPPEKRFGAGNPSQ
ncbi:MAG: hypothetical protein IPL51_06850 [Candidatus Competibacteraceae bacterium]|nr:hypothetical protein [Candidatus Competibacteraceae bacterium]